MWSFLSPINNGLGLISIRDDIMNYVPKNRYSINDTWNLVVQEVNENTTGLYDYNIMDSVNPNVYQYLFLSEMGLYQ